VLFVNILLLNTIVTVLAVSDIQFRFYCWQSVDGMRQYTTLLKLEICNYVLDINFKKISIY